LIGVKTAKPMKKAVRARVRTMNTPYVSAIDLEISGLFTMSISAASVR